MELCKRRGSIFCRMIKSLCSGGPLYSGKPGCFSNARASPKKVSGSIVRFSTPATSRSFSCSRHLLSRGSTVQKGSLRARSVRVCHEAATNICSEHDIVSHARSRTDAGSSYRRIQRGKQPVADSPPGDLAGPATPIALFVQLPDLSALSCLPELGRVR